MIDCFNICRQFISKLILGVLGPHNVLSSLLSSCRTKSHCAINQEYKTRPLNYKNLNLAKISGIFYKQKSAEHNFSCPKGFLLPRAHFT